MYFPYLRGRGSELLALRALAPKLALAETCIPIIEPVNSDVAPLKRAIASLNENNALVSVMLNPAVGELINRPKKILRTISLEDKNKKCLLGICVAANSSLVRLARIVDLIEGRNVIVIHLGAFPDQDELLSTLEPIQKNIAWQVFREGRVTSSYEKKMLALAGASARLEDKFIPRSKNAEYDDHPNEQYSDFVYSFSSLGYDGFADYLTIGERYVVGGGAAHAVAIHLTYPAVKSGEKTIWIRHFVSDDKTGPENPGGKFLQALKKFMSFYNAHKSELAFSDACKQFEKLYQTQKYPGLPKVKELSMRHHIELMLHEQ